MHLYLHAPEIPFYPMHLIPSMHCTYTTNLWLLVRYYPVHVFVWWEKGSVRVLRDIRRGSVRKAIM